MGDDRHWLLRQHGIYDTPVHAGPTTIDVDLIARAICAEQCAFYGEQACHWHHDDQGSPLPWPNPSCNEPGCQALAERVAACLAPSKHKVEE